MIVSKCELTTIGTLKTWDDYFSAPTIHIYQPILGNIDGDFVICLEYMEHTWHKNSNQISIIQVLIDVMQRSGECAPRDEVCPRKIRWKMLAMASTGPHRQQKSLKCVPFRRFTSCDANRRWTRVGSSRNTGDKNSVGTINWGNIWKSNGVDRRW